MYNQSLPVVGNVPVYGFNMTLSNKITKQREKKKKYLFGVVMTVGTEF